MTGATPLDPVRPWLLAFDTAAEACSAALVRLGPATTPTLESDAATGQGASPVSAPFHRFALAARGHGERLPGMVNDLLAEAGLSMDALGAVACGVGPGAFAGVRIGAGYAQGLALALGVPVVGLVSLELMAAGLFAQGNARAWCALDARMGEIYAAAFEADAEGLPVAVVAPAVVRPDTAVLPPSAWSGSAWAAGGPGLAAYPELLARAVAALGTPAVFAPDLLPDARHAAGLAHRALAAPGPHGPTDLRPVYLRDRVALTLDEQNAARQARG